MPPMVAPTNNQPATTDINAAYGSLGSVYDPQVAQIQAQQATALTAKNTTLGQLSQDHTTNLSSLDQAKANAFKTIGTNANAKGMTFSGYTPQMSTDYTNNTYTPGVNRVNTNYQRGVDTTNTNYNTNATTLSQKIADINQARSNAANSIVQNTIQANQAAARAAATRSASAATKASNLANAGSYTQGSQGQYEYTDSGGKPINMQQFISSTGRGVADVLGLLKSGTNYDKSIYNKVTSGSGTLTGPQLSALLQKYDTKGAYGYTSSYKSK